MQMSETGLDMMNAEGRFGSATLIKFWSLL